MATPDGEIALKYLNLPVTPPIALMNRRRNALMGTDDMIDSYDVFRANANNPKTPPFPYDTDPTPNIKVSENLTPGAKAALSAYYKKYNENVQKLNQEQVYYSMNRMGITPNANLALSRQLLVSEVDRKINRIIQQNKLQDVTFLGLLEILSSL